MDRIEIKNFSVCVPQFTPSVMRQDFLNEQIVTKFPTELTGIKKS